LTSLTFYGGVNEIGGNKILLQDKDTKVFLDFGMSFGKRGKYFDEFMSPRTATGLRDFIETGLIPNLDRVYRSDLMEMMGRRETDTDIDAVLLTHAKGWKDENKESKEKWMRMCNGKLKGQLHIRYSPNPPKYEGKKRGC